MEPISREVSSDGAYRIDRPIVPVARFNLDAIFLRDFVAQIFTSSNRLVTWLRHLDCLRQTA
jgi:hypothetical protein